MSVGSSLLIIPVQAKYFGVSELAVQWVCPVDPILPNFDVMIVS
jgi:hypothetical protein